MHAIPVRLRDDVTGTLNLFNSAPGGLDPAVGRGPALVDAATIGILQERATRQQDTAAGRCRWPRTAMIEQAKGILAERIRVTPDPAFIMLRRSQQQHRPLTQLAADVIGGAAGITPRATRPDQPRQSTESRDATLPRPGLPVR